MSMDSYENLDEDIVRMIPEWEKVTRNDGGKKFAEAQFNLGNVSIELGYIEEAISLWSNIERRDSAEKFASAKLNIAHVLHDNGNIYEALNEWSQIARSDSPKLYARAQFNIGTILRRQKNNEGALRAWQSIQRSDDAESYAKAQFSIGTILSESNKEDEALSAWRNIKRLDSPEMYAKSQYNIGYALVNKGNIEGALSAWRNIERSDDKETYAKAKVKIGFLLEEKQNYNGAITEWSKIERSDDPEAYAVAQSNIGYLSSDDLEAAIRAWSNIKESDDLKIYAHAQFNLGIWLINANNKKDVLSAKEAFISASDLYPYEAYCYIQICEFLLVEEKVEFGKKLQALLEEIILITKDLTLEFEDLEVQDQAPERKLAHYTSTHTADILLNVHNKEKVAGSFRLNTINNVNDPSEGQVLNSYLNEDNEEAFYAPDFDQNFQAFVSCFTFNHDSLNQFRLYGKKDNKEASGVSLVFNKDFFQSKNFLCGMSFLYPLNNSQSLDNNLTDTSDKALLRSKIDIKPVMRCIYIEPISEYIQLAQRSRITFYREFGATGSPEDKWNSYQKGIIEKTKNVKTSLQKLKDIYQNMKIEHIDDFNECSSFIDKTLLPLKYLIKHSAFQEEQECRIIYITSLDRPEVIMEFGQFLYVEYEADVKNNLDKIYIAPAANQYQPYLAKLLCDTNVKIELSNNPYRQI